MRVGVQFTGTVPVGQTKRWFTFNWPPPGMSHGTSSPTSPRPVRHRSTGTSR
jgi:hypothetical protein